MYLNNTHRITARSLPTYGTGAKETHPESMLCGGSGCLLQCTSVSLRGPAAEYAR